MNLQTTKQLNIDFSTQKYILVDVKQYDRNSRFILVTCYNQGSIMPINNNTCFAYIRYRKPDNHGVFNTCEITTDGKILIELKEQMLATIGMSYVDLVIHEAIGLGVDVSEDDDGEIHLTNIGENSILSTMTFCVNVNEAVVDNNDIESSYEYDALNDLLIEAKIDYQNVIKECRISERNAKRSEENAKESEINSKESEVNSKESEVNSKESEINAKISETNAKTSETNADISEENAKLSEANALVSETNAKESEQASSNYADWSKSYALGGTGLREDEDTKNSQYYYDQLRRVHTGTTDGLIPMGTIKFEELATAEKEVGYMYNMSTDFTTDESFRISGQSYEAGTHVYYTNDGVWDCLVGMTISIASLVEVEEYLQI